MKDWDNFWYIRARQQDLLRIAERERLARQVQVGKPLWPRVKSWTLEMAQRWSKNLHRRETRSSSGKVSADHVSEGR